VGWGIYTNNPPPPTKRKETTRYCESFGLRWQRLSINVSTVLTKVNVPVEDE
jgi:hypothetical protein